jgi:hypothetical protein
MDDGVMLGRAIGAQRSAEEWKAYARSLEKQLNTAQSYVTGMEAVKDAAVKELARLDPRNYLLVQENRQRIFRTATVTKRAA